MAYPTVAQVVSRAQVLLNDTAGDVWVLGTLLEHINDANTRVCNMFRDNGSQHFIARASYSNVATTTGIGFTGPTALPAGLIEPTEMWEKDVGATADQYARMTRVDELPATVVAQPQAVFWEWRGDTINFIGWTTNRDFLLEYRGGDPVSLVNGTDALPINGSLPAIARLVAASVAHSRGQHDQAARYETQAEEQILSLISQETKSRQGTPLRRRASSYARGGGYGPFSGV